MRARVRDSNELVARLTKSSRELLFKSAATRARASADGQASGRWQPVVQAVAQSMGAMQLTGACPLVCLRWWCGCPRPIHRNFHVYPQALVAPHIRGVHPIKNRLRRSCHEHVARGCIPSNL